MSLSGALVFLLQIMFCLSITCPRHYLVNFLPLLLSVLLFNPPSFPSFSLTFFVYPQLFDEDAEIGVKELDLALMTGKERLHVGFPEAYARD